MSRSTVHIGRDGWLFYVGGGREVVALYRRTFRLWKVLRAWRRTFEQRSRRLEAMGIRYISVVVPEKITILPDLTGIAGLDARLSPAARLGRSMRRSRRGRDFVDLVPIFSAHPRPTDLYPRTDTHWSYEGCLLAYREICRALGADPRTDLLDRPYVEATVGDLGVHVPDPGPDSIRLYSVLRHAERTRVNELVAAFFEGRIGAFPGVGAHAEFRNPSEEAQPQRVLIFGTSASNYVPMFLTAMLAETFREVDFIWSPLIDWDLVERLRPDIVVYEIIERALGWISEDKFDQPFAAAAALQQAIVDAAAARAAAPASAEEPETPPALSG